jgi:mannitol/fructose-specific phosphotransferase system IIA component (Ntr-type)
MTLATFTSPGLIIPNLRGDDVASILQELAQALHREHVVGDLLPFYQEALNREFMVSSDLGAGIAFPHARLSALKELCFAFGRTDKPLIWGSRASRRVGMVFLIAVPATDSTQYLLFNAGLARLARDLALMEQLHAAQDTFQILKLLKQIEVAPRPSAKPFGP